ncbi:hypothetical protein JD844_017991 [Phrynosoma platyrhinos]|uniref:STAS domain-containing protein n=1 Tax=Phrynosoma platyrhinos TaxID=52577 RepID=A0ABQ7SMN0_PHRPL|nr:hypothetical protein JD844_017991 [Phrynosoma platyrhinos]
MCQEPYDEIEPNVNIINERQPLRVTYNINRKVYNEEEFEKDHDRKIYSQTNKDFESPPTGRKIQCRFSCSRFRNLLIKMFPILNWICSYRVTEWILGDIHSGINVGMVQIFQGLSGILLTGLPLPVANSFYSAFCCSLTYVIFGTSRHVSIGSFSILNAMAASFHSTLNFNMLLGVFGLGFVTMYVSESLMNAYLTAAAMHVIISQLSFIFGIVIDFHSGPLAFFYNLAYYCMGLPKANSTSILLFLLSLLMLRVSKCIKITYKHYPVEFPMELILLAALIGVSLMLGAVLKLGYYFQFLPNAVLAAIILVNMFPFLEKFMDIPFLWRQDKYDFGIWIVTFLAVLCLGLDIGLGIAMGFAFFIISVRSHRMKMLTLGQIPNTNIYRSFSDYNEMNMKAVPLDENEMRALISVSMSSVKGQKKDLNCVCVCDPPEPLPRVPYTEKLIRRVRTANESFSSSSLALVRWTRNDNRYPSDTGYAETAAARDRAADHDYVKRKENLSRLWSCSDPPLTRSTTQLYPLDSDSAVYMIHTIILDFSMVHFVDLQASYLLRELCHAFQNIGITILIAACHPTVIRNFEKMDFFDQCVTKARFFPSLHDAVLYAVEPDLLQEMVPVEASVVPDEILADVHLDDQKDKRSQQSGRSRQSDRRSLQTNGIRDGNSVKTVQSDTYIDEPISDLFRTFSLQSDVDTLPHHLETSPMEENEDEQDWEGKWKYSNDV